MPQHTEIWEACIPAIFIETQKNHPLSSWPLLANNTLPESLAGDVTIVGYTDQQLKLAISHMNIKTHAFIGTRQEQSKRDDQGIPPFYFPAPHISRPEIVFYIKIDAVEQEYKNKVKEAEKRYYVLKKEAEKTAEREKAEIKARRDRAEQEAKDEYSQAKLEATETHVQIVIDIVKNIVLDLKSRHLNQGDTGTLQRAGTMNSTKSSCSKSSSTSSSSSASSSSCSAAGREDQQIKEWVDFAAERLEVHMNKSQARQRLMEEITTGALERQHQAQMDTIRKTRELERQLQELRLQLQQQTQQTQQHPPFYPSTQQMPPPAYAASVGITGADYSTHEDKKF
ncbi:hypothetical protein BGW38_000383 [Lunasporangiospora selenospora]|uniref:Uncharacterized protein n=1 Tax=Lunasporangiospora selenospora TaxID=979761 RepID=A0A9P6FX55_9FUNG|nr:hypothetical protein BGW38_000383 [Lunasporangiospora selenospora]